MTQPVNIVRVGATGQGKTQAAARDVAQSRDAEVVLDPEKDSLAATALVHATGPVLFDRLDGLTHALAYNMLTPSTHPDPLVRYQENRRRAEAFAAILLRRRDAVGMAHTPLMEEWVMAAILLYLYQDAL